MYRQGDVLISPITSIPNGVEKQKNEKLITLAYGEATGHHHSIVATEHTESFVDADGTLFLNLKKESNLTHQEHDTITLPKGKYKITIQREYSPEEIRNVRD